MLCTKCVCRLPAPKTSLENRLKLFAFAQQFEGLFAAMDASLSCVERALSQIKSSKRLKTLLQIILAYALPTTPPPVCLLLFSVLWLTPSQMCEGLVTI